MKKALLISLAMINLIDLGSASDSVQSDNVLLKSEVLSYFEQSLGVDSGDIEIKFIRSGKFSQVELNKFRFKIHPKDDRPNLGYQTLWIDVFEKGEFRFKFPVTLKVAVRMPVVVAGRHLNRKDVISGGEIRLEERLLERNWGTYFFDTEALSGMELKRIVKNGAVITKDMVRRKPVLRKGDEVEIRISAGALEIVTNGIARQDGFIGDKINVVCEKTRKQIAGTIHSSKVVMVKP